ncbi:pyridoxal-phosphate dependent enzyme [Natronobacterium gregoryi]|uniref:Threonine synthase n=2 Tax=Natronobacterium gregoryi TaxID=44930 RepID=L0AJ82_NATGS|nr:pyridoxal-phosphate dependent enzyme [Natronobacterium gregoryi]AFZ73509.1 threonine synthase [Natronobacterium gregoryi SP2]ELY68364.1 threonine synthase [Natronobacterium gregoryi SP2]PLK20588.1 threonine synthase [Natronobacterium gregoryi SP2]SFJ16153.1 threonine synthase-related protein [Natronobacterium gregoryi]
MTNTDVGITDDEGSTMTLGEGRTPLIPSTHDENLYYKHEGLNPSGSFKDRGTALTVSKALEEGIEKLHVCSSGNAALSLAVYTRRAGLECVCHVPEQTSESKKQLMEALGATLVEYDGVYEDIFHELREKDLDGWNVTPGVSNTSLEAYERIAAEILAQVVPEQVIVPCGNGTNLAGIWRGFEKHGESPAMVGVQMKGAAPIKKALEEEKSHAVVEDPGESLAEGIIASESFNCAEATDAITASDGRLEVITETELEAGLRELVREGILPEPTSAAVKPVADRYDGVTVAVVTGSGLKNYTELRELC